MSLSVFSRVIQLQWHHRSTAVFIYPCLYAYVPILFFPFNFHPHRPARGGDTASFQVKFSIFVHLRVCWFKKPERYSKTIESHLPTDVKTSLRELIICNVCARGRRE